MMHSSLSLSRVTGVLRIESVPLLSVHFYSGEINIILPHFLLQLFLISHQLQFAFRQGVRFPVTVLTQNDSYPRPSRFIARFHYVGTKALQAVKMILPC